MLQYLFTGNSTALFQLRLAGDLACVEWLVSLIMVMLLNVLYSLQGDRTEDKRDIIISAVVDAIEQLCNCGYTVQYIDSSGSGLRCSSNHPSQVVFRSKLYGTADTTASEVTTHINQWISGDVSIVILGLILDIDPTCPVQISSFSDPECQIATSPPPGTSATSPPATSPPPGTSATSPPATSPPPGTSATSPPPGTGAATFAGAAAAGVVVGIVIIAIAVVVVVIVRRRRASWKLRDLNERYIAIGRCWAKAHISLLFNSNTREEPCGHCPKWK